MDEKKDYAKGSLSGPGEEKIPGTSGAPSHSHPHHGAHVEQLNGGAHLVTKHHKDGSHSRHHAASMDEAVQHVMDHMGAGGEGAPEPEPGAGGASPEATPAPMLQPGG